MPKSTKKMPTKKTATKKKVATKKAAPKKEAPVKVEEPAPVKVEEPTPVSTEETPVVKDDLTVMEEELSVELADVLKENSEMQTRLREMNTRLRKMQRTFARTLKLAKRSKGRRAQTGGKARAPSGFAKPGPVSDELCTFLKVDKGTPLARTHVTKKITEYIKEHDLQDPKDKRRIRTDAALQKLLNVDKNTEVSYFNLQKYMKHHFGSSTSTVSA
jgi:upstream activation factor subunit UAF30